MSSPSSTGVGELKGFNIAPWWGLVEDKRLRLDYALKILEAASSLERAIVKGAPQPLDLLVERYRKARGKMGSNDRRVLALGVYGLARSRDSIVKLAGKGVGQGALLTVGLLDQLQDSQLLNIPGQFKPAKELLLELRAFREAAMQSIETEAGTLPSEVSRKVRQQFALLFSVPEFWLELGHWSTLGEAATKLASMRREQTLQLRVNTSRAKRDKVISSLIAEGYDAFATRYSPWGVSLGKRINLSALPLFKNGTLEVQDEGSQLVALLCEPIVKGAQVLDLCAGAGGKTLALAGMAPPDACIWSYDIDQKRLSRLIPRVERSGFGFENVRLISSESEFRAQGYDLVLVDAPCSSSGTLRRNPDIAWRWTKEELKKFQGVQYSLLMKAASLVKAGGTLVYSTCSIFETENADVVRLFLERNRECSLEAYSGTKLTPNAPGCSTGEVWLDSSIPGYMGDGFYCARIRRNA